MDVSPDDGIADVRERIWQRLSRRPFPNGVWDFELTLYTPISAISTSDADAFERAIAELSLDTQEGLALVKRLHPTDTVLKSGLSEPASEELHVLVLLPNVRKRKQEPDDIRGLLGLWQSKRIKGDLPPAEQLAQIADSPLSEDEKIPISDLLMGRLVSPEDEVTDNCTLDDVRLLFRASVGLTPLDAIFYAVKKPPPACGTEKSFIHFWDTNVRDMLEILLPCGKSIRNSKHHTATESLRPNYAFILNNLCLFRGEEKSPDSTKSPKAELATKLAWVYDPAPYVLGYYATGPDFTLVAITPPPQGQTLPVVHDIASANLRLRRDRIKNICRLIKLSTLFRTLAGLVDSPDAEFQVLDRDYGTVEIAGHGVIKKYTKRDKYQRIDHLKKVYNLLHEKEVPYVDELKTTFDSTAVIFPRGTSQSPETEKELLEALVCVLEALEVLHRIPLFHRDIRWPNVMRRLDDPQKWFIIDWDDADTPPATAQTYFDRRTHSPFVFSDGHGAEVDIWGVGELILQNEVSDVSLELQDLGQRMKDSMMSAQEALHEIREYQEKLSTV